MQQAAPSLLVVATCPTSAFPEWDWQVRVWEVSEQYEPVLATGKLLVSLQLL